MLYKRIIFSLLSILLFAFQSISFRSYFLGKYYASNIRRFRSHLSMEKLHLQEGTVLYNSATKQKEPFTPISEERVTFYSCGPTVYDYAHIGNFRAFLTYDIVKRWLNYVGYNVYHVCNLTDIDDKIIKKMIADNKSLKDVSNPFIKAFFEDLEVLNIIKANIYPKATEYIDKMEEMIRRLLQDGYAQERNGSIYFRRKSFKAYGSLLSKKQQDALLNTEDSVGADNKADFALWKGYEKENPLHSTIYWNTSFGAGRPGWHIECSAMSHALLGDSIDIHGGGIDLLFPHHCNEIAQSEAYTGKKFCNYWLHNGFITINDEKMSKSVQNFKTVRELVQDSLDARALRYFIVTSHYRNALNYNNLSIPSAKSVLQKIDSTIHNLQSMINGTVVDKDHHSDRNANYKDEMVTKCMQEFEKAMCDDLNTPRAIASFHELIGYANKRLQQPDEGHEDHFVLILQGLNQMDKVFGILYQPYSQAWMNKARNDLNTMSYEEAVCLAEKRWELKFDRKFQEADDIRKNLIMHGYQILDKKNSFQVVPLTNL